MNHSTTKSIDLLTEKPDNKLRLQTKCGPQLKEAVTKRISELGIDESKYLRRLVVTDITESKKQ